MRVISKAIFFNASWAFLITQSVIVPFLSFYGLSVQEILIIQAFHAIVLCASDIPSSLLSDIIGRKNILYAACIFRGIGGILFFYAFDFYGFIIAYFFIGIGNGFFFGSNISLLYDLEQEIKDSRVSAEKLLGTNHFYRSFSIVISSIIGGLVSQYSFFALALINAVTALIPLLILLSMRTVVLKKENSKKNFKSYCSFFLRSPFLLKGAILAGIVYSLAPFIALYLSQAILMQSGIALNYFGYLLAANQIFSAIVAKYIGHLNRLLGLRGIIFLLSALPVMAFYGMASLNVMAVIGGLLFLEAVKALSETTIVSVANHAINDDFRASVNSLISFGTYFLFSIFGIFAGSVIEWKGMETALYGFSTFYFGFVLLIMLPFMFQLMRSKSYEVG